MTTPPTVTGELDFDRKRGTLLLRFDAYPVEANVLEQTATAGYEPKAEHHVTIVGSHTLDAMRAELDAERLASLHDAIAELAGALDWTIVPAGRYVSLTKDVASEPVPRESVIELVDCPAMGAFYEGLRGIIVGFGVDAVIPTPPPHVTLVTRGSRRGIGVYSASELATLGKPYEIGGPTLDR
jgi:hypothetical protein